MGAGAVNYFKIFKAIFFVQNKKKTGKCVHCILLSNRNIVNTFLSKNLQFWTEKLLLRFRWWRWLRWRCWPFANWATFGTSRRSHLMTCYDIDHLLKQTLIWTLVVKKNRHKNRLECNSCIIIFNITRTFPRYR